MKTKLLKRQAVAAAITATLFSGANLGFAEEALEVSAAKLTREHAVQLGREFRSRTIRYDDLNLTTQVGVEALYRRISVAAGRVCHPQPDGRNLVMLKDWQQCYESALDNGVGSVNLPTVTRHHQAETGRTVDGELVAATH
jgi:UrcA family protein